MEQLAFFSPTLSNKCLLAFRSGVKWMFRIHFKSYTNFPTLVLAKEKLSDFFLRESFLSYELSNTSPVLRCSVKKTNTLLFLLLPSDSCDLFLLIHQLFRVSRRQTKRKEKLTQVHQVTIMAEEQMKEREIERESEGQFGDLSRSDGR